MNSKWLLALIVSVGLSYCAHKKSSAEQKAIEDKPILSEHAIPTVSTTAVKGDSVAFSIDYISVADFSDPQITFKLSPSNTSNALAAPYIQIKFKACPQKAASSLPPALTACVSGYTRNRVFSIPVFTPDFSLDLSYCTEEKCIAETRQEHNPDSLDSTDAADVKLAGLFVEQHSLNQSLRESAGKINKEIPALLDQETQCSDLFKQDAVDAIKDLSNYSLPKLEELFLTLPVDNFIKALSGEDKEQILQSMPENSTAQEIQSDAKEKKKFSLEDLDSLFFLLTTAYYSVTGLMESAQEFKDLYAWHTLLNARRTVVIDGKKVTLVRHKLSGFLVDPKYKGASMADMKAKGAKFYMEDEINKKPLKDARSGKFIEVSPDRLSVKYKDGHYYQYDYAKSQYTYVDLDGVEIKSSSILDRVNAALDVTHKKKIVVPDRVVVGDSFGDIDLSSGHPNFLDDKAVLEKHKMTLSKFDEDIKAKTTPIFQREETPIGSVSKVGGAVISAATTAVKVALLGVFINQFRDKLSLADTQEQSKEPCSPKLLKAFSDDFKDVAKLKTRQFLVNDSILTSI